jgi:hypothetical protein
MNIAYINLRLVPLIGVDKKTEQQAKAIDKLGITNFKIFILNPFKSKKVGCLEYVMIKTKRKPFHFLDYVYAYNFKRYTIIEKYIDLKAFDYIILRYPKADKSGIKFAKKYNVISEHHANEYEELRLEFISTKNIAVKLAKLFRSYLEKKYGWEILKNTKGLICISDEVSSIQQKRLKTIVPKFTIPNGVSVEDTAFTKYKPFDNNILKCIFIASANVPYHGIERIIYAIETYHGKIKIQLHIVGHFPYKKFSKYNFIHFHGPLYDTALDSLISKMNLGISTLGVYKKKTNEPNSIKTREYIARGLPFILAYDDTDLESNSPQKMFYLKFPNNDTPIDMRKIILFLREINKNYSVYELSAYMRQYAYEYLDWKIKMKQYVDFVESIHHNSKAGNLK